MDVLDSIFNIEDNPSQIFNIDLQPSNGSNDKRERSTENSVDHMQRISDNVGDLINERPQGGESISSGGRASEI
jgi:hypothetical protein